MDWKSLITLSAEFETHKNMKCRTKSEVAQAVGMSDRTFSRWFSEHIEYMQRIGVKPTQRLLPPKAVKYICYELGIDESDF